MSFHCFVCEKEMDFATSYVTSVFIDKQLEHFAGHKYCMLPGVVMKKINAISFEELEERMIKEE